MAAQEITCGCGYRGFGQSGTVCPRCGLRVMAARTVHVLGWIFVFLGTLLVGIMSVVTYNTLPQMLHPGVEIHGSVFDGTPTLAAIAIAIYAGVFLFAGVCITSGVMQIRSGIRPLWLQAAVQAIIAVMMVVGLVLEFVGK